MTQPNARSIRKDEHVRHVLNQPEQIDTDFNRVHLIHHPCLNLILKTLTYHQLWSC